MTTLAAPTSQVRTGRDALLRLGDGLDELHQQTCCPVTARRLWHQTWLDATDAEPLVVTVAAADGSLLAAAPLALRPGRILRVVALGDGASDEARLPAATPEAAGLLAAATADALHGLGRPWLLSVRHLDPADAAVGALARALRWSAVLPGDVSPRLHLQDDRSLRAHVSRNHHQQVRRMRNRLTRDNLDPQIEHLRAPDEIAAVWPEVERVCRARDLQLRGRSGLEDPVVGPFVRAVVQALAARGDVRLTTLRLDGRLAAYVLCFVDGDARRMWNCRLDPDLQDYGVGRIANDAALEDALADPSCRLYDWMRGEEPYKASMSDHAHRAVDLTGASSRALWGVVAASARVRERVREARDAGGRTGRLIAAAQPHLQRLDRVR